MFGAVINFFAEIVDVDIHDVGDGVAVHAPDLLDDGDAGNRAAVIAEKKIEQRIFLRAEVDGVAGAADLVGNAIDLKVLEFDDVVRSAQPAAENGVDFGDQFGDRKRLDDDVIGTGLEKARAIFGRRVTGEQDQRNIRPTALEFRNCVSAMDSRQLHVQENDIESRGGGQRGELLARADLLDLKIFLLKTCTQEFRERCIRFRDKKAHDLGSEQTFWKGGEI